MKTLRQIAADAKRDQRQNTFTRMKDYDDTESELLRRLSQLFDQEEAVLYKRGITFGAFTDKSGKQHATALIEGDRYIYDHQLKKYGVVRECEDGKRSGERHAHFALFTNLDDMDYAVTRDMECDIYNELGDIQVE